VVAGSGEGTVFFQCVFQCLGASKIPVGTEGKDAGALPAKVHFLLAEASLEPKIVSRETGA
jgi:hypothetical protein